MGCAILHVILLTIIVDEVFVIEVATFSLLLNFISVKI